VQDVLRRLYDAGCAQAVDGRVAAMSEVFALQGMPAAYRLKP
jgi:hypothetical protein